LLISDDILREYNPCSISAAIVVAIMASSVVFKGQIFRGQHTKLKFGVSLPSHRYDGGGGLGAQLFLDCRARSFLTGETVLFYYYSVLANLNISVLVENADIFSWHEKRFRNNNCRFRITAFLSRTTGSGSG